MNKNKRLYIIYFIVAFVFKSAFFLYKIADYNHVNKEYTNIIGLEGGDTSSYISPIDNFIEHGNYFDDHRMPGYGFFYFIFRLFLTKTLALNSLLILQLIVDSISVVVLAKISEYFSKSKVVFFLTFLVYCISTFVSIFDVYLLSEALCTSFLIFSLYFLLKPAYNNNKNIDYFFSGLFLTGSVFMRPIVFPLFVLFLLYISLSMINKTVFYKFKIFLFFLLSFILIDGVWTYRNYIIYNKFYPLQKSVFYLQGNKSYSNAMVVFISSYGGSHVSWDPKADITFYKPYNLNIGNSKIEVPPPSYIYTSEFNYDSLLLLKNDIRIIDSIGINSKNTETLNQKTIERLNRYTNSIKSEKPFLYYVSSRFSVLKTFVFHSGTYNLFDKLSSELNFYEYIVKLGYSLLYCLIMFFGIIGGFYFIIFKSKNRELLVVCFTAFYLLLAYPFVFRMSEYRYLVTAYPFLLLTSVFFTFYISRSFYKLVKRNNTGKVF